MIWSGWRSDRAIVRFRTRGCESRTADADVRASVHPSGPAVGSFVISRAVGGLPRIAGMTEQHSLYSVLTVGRRPKTTLNRADRLYDTHGSVRGLDSVSVPAKLTPRIGRRGVLHQGGYGRQQVWVSSPYPLFIPKSAAYRVSFSLLPLRGHRAIIKNEDNMSPRVLQLSCTLVTRSGGGCSSCCCCCSRREGQFHYYGFLAHRDLRHISSATRSGQAAT
jgi:hypothetical protein